MGKLFRFIPDDRRLRIGLVVFVVICLLSIFQPAIVNALIGKVNPMSAGTFKMYDAASPQHWLGTDRYGRDVLSLLLIGLRFSLSIGVLAGTISTVVGAAIGLIAGYYGGPLDNVLRSVTDVILVIPTLPLLIMLSAYVKTLDVPTMALILSIFGWPFAARTIRSQVLSLRERGYIDLARVSGMSRLEIVFQEVMPNLLPYLGVTLAATTVGAILAEFGLEVIGLGPGNISTLGLMINWAIGWGVITKGYWSLLAAPATVLVLIFVSLNLINIGLEQAFNPRLKGTTGT